MNDPVETVIIDAISAMDQLEYQQWASWMSIRIGKGLKNEAETGTSRVRVEHPSRD